MFDQFVPYYDADYGDFQDDVLFYREYARMAGGSVLELMCGTGRVAIPLAQAKLNVVGIDIAPAMIEQANAAAVSAGVDTHLKFAVADVTDFQLDQQFGMAFVAINSFMHLETTQAQIAALHAIKRHLKPNGLLLLDLFNPEPSQLSAVDGLMVLDKSFRASNGNLVQKFVYRSVDLAAQHQQVQFCYDEIQPDGQVRRCVLPFGMRWLYRYEAEHLLARCGFALQAVYGSYELDPYTSESERMLIVARGISQ
ncbi:class I SAM-dependent methyltransferase [Herpetosiphon sp. NSE202]|uniref:class I SAM-dependent methyltransferase n=1 Tax=Herpetosiphon sp. NSE202 TaxID=3351349 RepID=UPI0036318757